jgi:hypothetical protein
VTADLLIALALTVPLVVIDTITGTALWSK